MSPRARSRTRRILLDRGIPVALVAAFALLALPFLDFVLDDAYITFRYAEHLVEGHGLVYNVGGDPVEGASSMLWVLVTALGLHAGLPAPEVAKGVGLIAGAASIALVYAYATRRGADRSLAAVAAAPMALSPAFAFVALQGMETTLAGLLALVATVGALEAVRAPRRRWLVLVPVALFFAVLARPDVALFGAGLLAGTLWCLDARHGRAQARRFVGYTAGLLLVPGLAYMGARWLYFGYPFPNTFYVKEGGSIAFLLLGAENVFTFVTVVVGPLLPLAAWRLAQGSRARETLARLSPPIAGVGLFLPLWFAIAPIQGFLWRFQMPVLPVICLVLALAVRTLPSPSGLVPAGSSPWREPKAWLAVALVALLLVFPLHPYRTVDEEYSDRHQGDRVAVGQALAPLADTDAHMLVTESGAVPYYSGWTAVDWLGLNNETIAHEGLTAGFVDRYDPDLVMMLSPVEPGVQQDKRPVLTEHLVEEGYRLGAVLNKTLNPEKVHLYFVDPASPHAEEIACQLVTVDGVGYDDRDTVLDRLRLPLESTNATAERCRETTSPREMDA